MLTDKTLEEILIDKISKEYKVNKNCIKIKCPSKSDDRFWIDILNPNFRGDLENDDPILEQLVLVSHSKIK